MRVYVAGKFEDKPRVKAAQIKLQAAGHTITHDWTPDDDTGLTPDERREYHRSASLLDAYGAATCDALVLLDNPRCRGAYVEFGIALALGADIFVIPSDPPCECVFYYHPLVERVPDVETVIARLQGRA